MSAVDALDGLDAEQVIARLGLEYLDGEGVWFRLLWRNDSGSAIYGLLTPEHFSALHRLREDELWVHVAGAPVDMLLLHPDGESERAVLGRGEHHALHVLVPAGTWQGSSPQGEWSLVVCSLAPPFSGLELADAATDLSRWSGQGERIQELIRG